MDTTNPNESGIKSDETAKNIEDKSNDDLDNIENDVEKVEITENMADVTNHNGQNKGDKNEDPESGRKTPSNLTAQGYFDLKFYHSRLW